MTLAPAPRQGDPAGIGPEIARLARGEHGPTPVFVFGDPDVWRIDVASHPIPKDVSA